MNLRLLLPHAITTEKYYIETCPNKTLVGVIKQRDFKIPYYLANLGFKLGHYTSFEYSRSKKFKNK